MKDRKIKLEDRLAAASVMAVASFITGILLWGFWLLVALGGFSTTLPFVYIWYFVLLFTFLAFISPELAINLIGSIWNGIWDAIKKDRDGPWWSR